MLICCVVLLLPSWFPGAGFKREAATWKLIVEEMFMRPYRDVKAALVRHILLYA